MAQKYDLQIELKKRFGAFFNYLSRTMRRDWRHVASNTAIPEGSDQWLNPGRSAYCSQTLDGSQACVSWQGGWQDTQVGAVRSLIIVLRNTYGQDQDLSVKCDKCGLTCWWSKRDNCNYVDMCLGDMPNGC